MKNNILIPIILLTVFAIGGIYVLSSFTQNQATTNAAVQTSQTIATSPSSSTGGVYTLADVARHSSESDCWMAIDGKVYDVSSYVTKHPDGASILRGCGIDATTIYNEVRVHMRKGTMLLPDYMVGSLK